MATIKSWMNSGNWFDSSNYIPTIPQPPLSSKARASYDTWGKEQFRTLWEGRAIEQERLLKEVEDKIRRIESLISSGRAGVVEELILQDLVKERDRILNPMEYRIKYRGARPEIKPTQREREIELGVRAQGQLDEVNRQLADPSVTGSRRKTLEQQQASLIRKQEKRATAISAMNPLGEQRLEFAEQKEVAKAEKETKKEAAANALSKIMSEVTDQAVLSKFDSLATQLNLGIDPDQIKRQAIAIAQQEAEKDEKEYQDFVRRHKTVNETAERMYQRKYADSERLRKDAQNYAQENIKLRAALSADSKNRSKQQAVEANNQKIKNAIANYEGQREFWQNALTAMKARNRANQLKKAAGVKVEPVIEAYTEQGLMEAISKIDAAIAGLENVVGNMAETTSVSEAPTTFPSGKMYTIYNSPEEVRSAYNAKELTEEQAVEILQRQFGQE